MTVEMHLAGYGAGKTYEAMRRVEEWATENPGCRIALVAHNKHSIQRELLEGGTEVQYVPSRRTYVWPNGSIAEVYSPERPDEYRGPQFHYAVGDQLEGWSEEAYYNLINAVRLGDDYTILFTATKLEDPAVKRAIHNGFRGTLSLGEPASYQFLAPQWVQRVKELYFEANG